MAWGNNRQQPARDTSSSTTERAELAAGTNGLADLLRFRSLSTPHRRPYSYLGDGEDVTDVRTFRDLADNAERIAGRLRGSLHPGDRVILIYPPGLEFHDAFWACLLGGYIAVPVAPPQPSRSDSSRARLAAIVASSGAAVVLTTGGLAGRLTEFFSSGDTASDPLRGLRIIDTDQIPPAPQVTLAFTQDIRMSSPGPDAHDDTAYLQYSSGSTGIPKGVAISNGNVLANMRLITRVIEADTASLGVSWLPVFHDMGLLSGVVLPVFADCEAVQLSPMAFVQRPSRWPAAMSRFAASHTVAPNFAFELAVRRVPEATVRSLDLSRLHVALCGAEPIRADTISGFTAHFAPAGLHPNTVLPCYGLAEATLLVSGGPARHGVVTASADPAALRTGAFVPASDGGRQLVASGELLDGADVQIVSAQDGSILPDGHVGEIHVSGPSVASRYYNEPEHSGRTFGIVLPGRPGKYLRTGDLGFVTGGRLYVTGRSKDVIIVNGHNHYPTDIENSAVTSHSALRADRCAAFQVDDDGIDRLVLVAELNPDWRMRAEAAEVPAATPTRHRTATERELLAAVRTAVSAEHQLRLDEVVVVRPGGIPVTSSGKIQRFAVRQAYQDRQLRTAEPM